MNCVFYTLLIYCMHVCMYMYVCMHRYMGVFFTYALPLPMLSSHVTFLLNLQQRQINKCWQSQCVKLSQLSKHAYPACLVVSSGSDIFGTRSGKFKDSNARKKRLFQEAQYTYMRYDLCVCMCMKQTYLILDDYALSYYYTYYTYLYVYQ